MRVEVRFHDERFDLEVPEDRLVGAWHGPTGVVGDEVGASVRDALEHPRGFPPLRQAVVPGDRVVIPWDPDIPEAGRVLGAVCDVLTGAGVEAHSIRVLAAGAPRPGWDEDLPPGVAGSSHEPDDRSQLAYLASTAQGRRVYLNRHLTDADCVVPVGLLGYDPVLGYRGPWGVIFPGLSDADTQRAYRAQASDGPPDPGHARPALAESEDVSWLLGSQFHLGLVGGVGGLAGVVAGLEAEVRAEGDRRLDAAWSFRAERRAGVVVVGIGPPGRPTRVEDLAGGLATAGRLVRRGGKIVALSRAGGPIGPALQRLVGVADPRAGLAALRGAEGEPDYPAARQLARVLAWADVYLLSALEADQVEDLAMIPLGRPAEALRLAVAADSCLIVSQADRTRADVAEDADD
jgi:lactate racemase